MYKMVANMNRTLKINEPETPHSGHFAHNMHCSIKRAMAARLPGTCFTRTNSTYFINGVEGKVMNHTIFSWALFSTTALAKQHFLVGRLPWLKHQHTNVAKLVTVGLVNSSICCIDHSNNKTELSWSKNTGLSSGHISRFQRTSPVYNGVSYEVSRFLNFLHSSYFLCGWVVGGWRQPTNQNFLLSSLILHRGRGVYSEILDSPPSSFFLCWRCDNPRISYFPEFCSGGGGNAENASSSPTLPVGGIQGLFANII